MLRRSALPLLMFVFVAACAESTDPLPFVDFSAIDAATVERECTAALAGADALLAGVVAVPDAGRTFMNTVRPVDLVGNRLGNAFGRYAFLAYVSTDEAMRDAARAQEELLEKYKVDLGFREDVYRAVLAFSHTDEAGNLTGERKRFLDFTLRDYRRNGFALDAAGRDEIQELKNRLVELGLEFEQNLAEWEDGIEVPEERAGGLPEEFLAGLERTENGAYFVSLDYPELFPFMNFADDGALRHELLRRSWNAGAPRNIELLEEAIGLRHRIAELLGYDSWAHYVLEVRMAKTPDQVLDFLDDLGQRVRPRLESDIVGLRATAGDSDPDGNVDYWDWRYLHDRQMRDRFAVDASEISQYFPLDRVLEGMFDITQEVFGLTYVELASAAAWHDEVQLFEIRDTASGDLVAYFYTDLFPRDGKFGHAAAFPLRPGGVIDGKREIPVSAIVANFTKPTADAPSLLTHDEVVTLFHEFGHILHETLTMAELTRFAGAETEQDFVEAPSQNLEHWVWEPEVLDRFAAHWQTGEKMPREMIEGMVAAKHLNTGIRYLRQVFYATLDMRYCAPGAVKDTDAILEELHPISGFPSMPDTHFQAGFGHLFGYDAGYYGYLWSKVYGDDMYSAFEESGILNPEVGMRYRREIYEKGGTLDGDELIRNFLGREPSRDAFLKELGLGAS